jgi:cell division GTPase FtsZ
MFAFSYKGQNDARHFPIIKVILCATSIFSVLRASGVDRANKVVAMASRHNVLPKIQHAQSVISSTTATEEIELTEYEDIADQVKEKLTRNKADSQVCFGLAFDDMGDDICYSMIATGIQVIV